MQLKPTALDRIVGAGFIFGSACLVAEHMAALVADVRPIENAWRKEEPKSARALESPRAIARLRLFTFSPLPRRPLFTVLF